MLFCSLDARMRNTGLGESTTFIVISKQDILSWGVGKKSLTIKELTEVLGKMYIHFYIFAKKKQLNANATNVKLKTVIS